MHMCNRRVAELVRIFRSPRFAFLPGASSDPRHSTWPLKCIQHRGKQFLAKVDASGAERKKRRIRAADRKST